MRVATKLVALKVRAIFSKKIVLSIWIIESCCCKNGNGMQMMEKLFMEILQICYANISVNWLPSWGLSNW